MHTIGERLCFLRKEKGLSQADVMKALHFDNLGKYEINERVPKVDTLIALAGFFQVSLDWLLTGKASGEDTANRGNPEPAATLTPSGEQAGVLLSREEAYFLSLIRQLTESNSYKAEGYIEGLLSTQKKMNGSGETTSSTFTGPNSPDATTDKAGA